MQKNIALLIEQKHRIIPVINFTDLENIKPIVTALLEGGLTTIEIALRNDLAYQAINKTHELFPNLMISAGSVLHTKQIENLNTEAIDFIISPGITTSILNYCQQKHIDILPGISSASEIMLGLEYGLQYFKFFPAENYGGAKTLKAFHGPFPDLSFLASGGVNTDNVTDYLQEKNVFAIAGSWLVTNEDITQKNWKNITNKAKYIKALEQSIPRH